MTGRGTKGEPWDFVTALSNPSSLLTGDGYGKCLHLLDGTYQDDFVSQSSMSGQANYPITIEPYNNGRAKIDGSITWRGNNLLAKNLEIIDLDFLTRTTATSGSNPPDIPVNQGMNIFPECYNIIFVNCIIHDCRQGFYVDFRAQNIEFNGCIIFNNGWIGPDRWHGHGAYIQNQNGGVKLKNCIIFNQAGYGVHAYGEIGQYLDNIIIDGCTCFKNGEFGVGTTANNILVGGYGIVANNVVLRNNMTYGNTKGVNIGYNGGATGVVLTDNYFPDGIKKVNATIDTETGNHYGPATGNQAFLIANDYDTNRANLTIYNEAGSDTVNMDVSSVFNVGDSINAINVQDYFVDIQSLTVAGDGTIPVDMQAANRSVVAPQGLTAPATTFPDFGCFVLERV